jgi:predicted ester cyclase
MADAKKIVKRLTEEPWKGNLDVIDELVAPSYIGQAAGEPEPIQGPQGLRKFVETYRTGFPDGSIIVDDQIAEGDKVATRWTGRGTQTGEIAGIAATGKEVTVTGLTISRIEGGQVIEEWITWDTLGMLVQLGAIPTPIQA